ncbi:MAG: RNA polymerase sigma factor [Candidatus Colwellbacteria bacterium]|nr:RNA polymerase sigma factor [Candidatus Colwellbacteria bacterium]
MRREYLKSYEEFSDAIFRYCYLRISDRDRAQDLMQETFLNAWGYIKNGNKVLNFKAFIYRTATNLIVDEYRRRKKNMSLDKLQTFGFDKASTDHEAMFNGQIAREVIEFMEKLDDKYKEVLLLKFVEDLSYKEIAEVLGITEKNVSVRISRGSKKLRKILR